MLSGRRSRWDRNRFQCAPCWEVRTRS